MFPLVNAAVAARSVNDVLFSLDRGWHCRVMVLDEPTAGQDTDNVLRLMDDLTRPGQFDALVFATHDLELVRAYANRVVVMSAGQIVADGAPETVLSDRALLERCRLV